MYDLTFMYFLYYFLAPMCIKSNLSFILNHERHYLKIYGIFHFSDIQCYIIFLVKMVYFWTFILEFKPLPAKKTHGMLYTVGFKILSRL